MRGLMRSERAFLTFSRFRQCAMCSDTFLMFVMLCLLHLRPCHGSILLPKTGNIKQNRPSSYDNIIYRTFVRFKGEFSNHKQSPINRTYSTRESVKMSYAVCLYNGRISFPNLLVLFMTIDLESNYHGGRIIKPFILPWK